MKGSPVRVRASAYRICRYFVCFSCKSSPHVRTPCEHERLDRTQEVAGSSPAGSITKRPAAAGLFSQPQSTLQAASCRLPYLARRLMRIRETTTVPCRAEPKAECRQGDVSKEPH